MSQDDPWMTLLVVGVTGYVFWLWLGDFRRAQKGANDPRAFPGATTCPALAVWVSVAGALALLALETGGEYALGISGGQSDIKAIFLLSMVAAAFGEELVVRGFLVVTKHGRLAFIASISGFSLLFVLLHPYFWEFSVNGFWSSGMLFAFSLWMYAMRFAPFNPRRSLIPCIAGHLAKNLGVFAIKFAQGHVAGWW